MSKFLVYTKDYRTIFVTWKEFPGGELHPNIATSPFVLVDESIAIDATITDTKGVMQLLLLNDALRGIYGPRVPFHLHLPYFPYARQDRRPDGEALGVKVMADLINSMKFDSVNMWDVHSPVTLALVNNAKSTQIYPVVAPGTVFVSPDAGAEKRVRQVAATLNGDMITATKQRDTKTGKIHDTTIHLGNLANLRGRDLMIVDDICDGGATFTALAEELHNYYPKSASLFVTHGIFSKGLDVLTPHFKEIQCPNVWPNIPNHPILRRL